jgi:hypothetical protein
MKHAHYQRGQTITFYVFGVIIALALTLFVMNYTNTVRWHIRAQNAADEVAMASLAGEASLENQRTMALYAMYVDEWRIRSIVQSMANAANAQGLSTTESTASTNTGTCNYTDQADDSGYDCDNAYDQQPAYYDTAVSQYAQALNTLENLTNNPPVPSAASGSSLPSPLPSVPANSSALAAFSMAANGSSCQPTGAFDCSFYYNANLTNTGPNTKEIVDVVACRNVTATAHLIFGSGIFQSQFQAVGNAAATLIPVSETFKPGVEPDPSATGKVYLPVEQCPPSNSPWNPGTCSAAAGWMAASPYVVNFANLSVTATFYVPAPTTPLATPPALKCEQG